MRAKKCPAIIHYAHLSPSLSLSYFLTPPSPASPRAHTFCLLLCHTSSVLFQFSIFSFLMYYSSKRLTTSTSYTSLFYQQFVIFLGDLPAPVSLLAVLYRVLRPFVANEERFNMADRLKRGNFRS